MKDCERCVNPMNQWAALLLSEKRLGDILVIRLRKKNLKQRIENLFNENDFKEIQKLVDEEFDRRVKSGEIEGEIGT